MLSLEVVLADGTLFHAERVSVAEAQRRSQRPGRTGEIWRALSDLALEVGERPSDLGLPELARGFSGYGLDRLLTDGFIDPLALLVGGEGTLGIAVRATLALTPLPAHRCLAVGLYPTMAEALADAVDLRGTKPSAIECFDEHTLAAGRSSPAWPALDAVVGNHHGAVLLIEYESDTPFDAGWQQSIESRILAGNRAVGAGLLDTPADQQAAWKVRADAVGLVARTEVGVPGRSARPVAMVEDCAVPVEVMVDFIEEFRALLDGHGLSYAMYGHADVGCVHVRPALDLTDPEHESLVRTLTDAVVERVHAHGGVLWGEHGRGFRSDVVSALLPAETIDLMRRAKTIFDPHDLMNPGKLYRPLGVDEPLVAVDAVPRRGAVNRAVPVEIRQHFDHAFACNGNGLCQQHSPRDVMCPCLLYTSPSPRDATLSRMPSSA